MTVKNEIRNKYLPHLLALFLVRSYVTTTNVLFRPGPWLWFWPIDTSTFVYWNYYFDRGLNIFDPTELRTLSLGWFQTSFETDLPLSVYTSVLNFSLLKFELCDFDKIFFYHEIQMSLLKNFLLVFLRLRNSHCQFLFFFSIYQGRGFK